MNNVGDWLISNKLTLNIDKSKYMIIHRKKNKISDEFSLAINGSKLERCKQYKYLGVFIDDKLTWKSHVQHICTKIGRTCGALAKLRYCLDMNSLKSVYYALVYSHIQYCNLIWGDATETILKPLHTLLNRIVRIMTFAPFQSSNPQQFYDEIEILNLKQIHILEKAKFMFKFKNKKLPSNFDGYFQEAGEHHNYNYK